MICTCGAEITVTDGSEDRVTGVVALWLASHRCSRHRPSTDNLRRETDG